MDYCESRQLSDSLDLAIRSLQAWEEVLAELEVKQKSTHDYALDVEDDLCLGKARGFARAIEIINQHLAEIEE